jgi:hypothetical protein
MQPLTFELEHGIAMSHEMVHQKCLNMIPVPVSTSLQELH